MAIRRTVWGPQAYFEGDWGVIVLCTVFLVSSSINVSVSHIIWLNTFWTDLVYMSEFLTLFGSLQIILIFYCCITNCHMCSSLKQHIFIISQFWWVRGLGTTQLDLCSGSHKAAAKLSVRAMTSFEAWGPLPSSQGCWENSFPCSCRIHGGLFLQGQQAVLFELGRVPVILLKSSSD